MTTKTIFQRTRFFLAVEGQGEQSFIKWLGELADHNGLHVTLDCQPLGGGGYRKMLERTIRYRRKKERHKAKATFLLVDSDRSVHDDGWTISELQTEAAKNKIELYLQIPNQEGLLLRMLPNNERLQPNIATVRRQLLSIWSEYQKPVDARMLASKFTLADLQRVAKVDAELKKLLLIIGFGVK